MLITKQEALDYHSQGRHGKIEVVPTKPCSTQRDLSLAYTPGVAQPCLAIEQDPDLAYAYTAKGNLVAVVSNGTAVLGLGNIGALAGKPVMEGKGVLFKRFADIDVFDLELATEDPEEIIKVVKLLEPTFGGINLEDIKAPECFYIEDKLKELMDIPVFHDDQHGTAIISGAALLNAVELAGKKIDEIRVVFNGAGASGIACARFYVSLGVDRARLMMCDSEGVIYKGREKGMNPFKEEFAVDTPARTLAEAMRGADVFVGLSKAGAVTQDMVRAMAPRPIVFAMANPDPEITYPDAMAARDDLIMATGRSDYPNQVNNVLGFPFIFRGALDVRARAINEPMKLAAARALAALAREDVPDMVCRAYGVEYLRFGPAYIIPKPVDYRVLLHVAPAVAGAAMESGVARVRIDLAQYRDRLEQSLGKSREFMRLMINKARLDPKRIVFPEGSNAKILRASHIMVDEGIGRPVLLGDAGEIRAAAAGLGIELRGVEIVQPATDARRDAYAAELYRLRQRKGVSQDKARAQMLSPTVFGAMMVHMGDGDALVSGVTMHYPDTIRPALQIIGKRADVAKVAGLYIMIVKNEIFLFADATVNIEPDAVELADIAIMAAEVATKLGIEPRIAMLSFANFGSARHPLVDKVRRATEIVKQRAPHLQVDGEMQADTAVTPGLLDGLYPFNTLGGRANVLIFPDLEAGNVAYKLLQRLGGAEAIGPILMGMRKPVHVLQQCAEVADIVNIAAIAVVDAQDRSEQ
jgi:malate dehydrogenase (oxaloacetate-decarboxylating)(NADP+)